jgi:hypothetical protein
VIDRALDRHHLERLAERRCDVGGAGLVGPDLARLLVAEALQKEVPRWPHGWIIINVGGGPTDDKPDVVLEPPKDSRKTSSFLNIRVADIHKAYAEWKGRGAEFLTPPKQHEHEIRCYMRDPDGYLIEVGQATGWPES